MPMAFGSHSQLFTGSSIFVHLDEAVSDLSSVTMELDPSTSQSFHSHLSGTGAISGHMTAHLVTNAGGSLPWSISIIGVATDLLEKGRRGRFQSFETQGRWKSGQLGLHIRSFWQFNTLLRGFCTP